MQKGAALKANFQCTGRARFRVACAMMRRTRKPPRHRHDLEIGLKSLADVERFSYDRDHWTMITIIRRRSGIFIAKTFTADASRPSGGGNHAAADYFRGRHRLQ
jgi:hypothetical protein